MFLARLVFLRDTELNRTCARFIQSFIDPSLSWKDIPWFRSITKSRFASSFFVLVQC